MNSRNARYVAVGGAAAAAVLYFLIGFEVLVIGESKTGANDILGFGLSAGTTFALIAILVALVHRRWVLAIAALLDAAVIVGYFAFAGVRDPAYEPWGLLVKAAQLVLLAGVGYLLVRGRAETPARPAAHA
jgi:hypothetical protein